jgi:hypothetical protein
MTQGDDGPGLRVTRLAARLRPRVEVTTYRLTAADRALDDLATGAVTGVAVLLR